MNSSTPSAPQNITREVRPITLLLLAVATGTSVASLYYSQPILGTLAGDMQVNEHTVGLVPTLTQLGYALGILLLAPLGDRFDRRSLIVIKSGVLALALLACGVAPSMAALLAASLAVGIAATVTQDIVPAAATLAPAATRGRTIGMVMTGLLLGILLSRVVSGFVAQWFGWRSIYLAAAVVVVLIAIPLWRGLPRFAPTTQAGYFTLMRSLLTLFVKHASLRKAMLTQGLLSVAFSGFWSMLAVMLHHQFELGSAAAGLFGLAGAAGALAAPIAGRLADKRGPQLAVRLGGILVMVSFALLFLMPLLPLNARLVLLVIATIGFDFGVQASLVSNQTIIYSIDPDARSRLNALYVTGIFVGMSSGAALAGVMMTQWAWPGVVVLATLASLGAVLVQLRRNPA